MKATKRLVALLAVVAMLVVPVSNVFAGDVVWGQNEDPIDWYFGDAESDATVGAVESPAEAPTTDLVTFTIESTGKTYTQTELDELKVKLTGINKNSKKLTIAKKVDYDGKRYKVVAFGNGALNGAEKLKKINVRPQWRMKFGKNAFGNIDTSKITINFNAKMSDETFAKVSARLREIGFEGTIKKTLKV
jgi:hypothetical protein